MADRKDGEFCANKRAKLEDVERLIIDFTLKPAMLHGSLGANAVNALPKTY